MRYLLLLLILSPLFSFSQAKKDTKVIVTVSDTANLFNRVALALYEKGYTLEQKDEALKFLATGEKKLKRWDASVKVRALIKDATITFTGLYAFNFEIKALGTSQQRTFDPVEYRGMKGSILMDSWEEVVAIAKGFGADITYSK